MVSLDIVEELDTEEVSHISLEEHFKVSLRIFLEVHSTVSLRIFLEVHSTVALRIEEVWHTSPVEHFVVSSNTEVGDHIFQLHHLLMKHIIYQTI